VRRLTRSGVVSVVAGNGSMGYSGDGGPATSAELAGPGYFAVDPHGNLYIADVGNARILKNAADGTITTVAGGGTKRFAHGVLATEAELIDVRAIGVVNLGSLYIAEMGAILRVTPDGLIRFVALTSLFSLDADAPPRNLRNVMTPDVFFPSGLSSDAEGNIWVADTFGEILRISANPDLPVRRPIRRH